jgi:hypothetical protein
MCGLNTAGLHLSFFHFAFLDDAFVRLAHALDAVLQFAVVVGKLPDNLVFPVCRRAVGKTAAEANGLSAMEFGCHRCSD